VTSQGEFAGDVIVLATGVVPNVSLAADAGLATDPKHGIVVDEFLVTADPDVYAAGDVAFRPGHPMGLSGEHHLNAKWQGTAAGANMAGANEPYTKVPYFWTDFLDLHMILRGHPENAVPARLIGDRAAGEFIELYAGPDGTLAMGIAISHDEPSLDPISDRIAESIGQPIDAFEAP
jgi:3-phenylpropionate/trans-cinnamate dioxygenase ferredoxin reductase subunit